MIFSEPIYDLDLLSRYNLHVHTHYSSCARPEMVVPAIMKAAKEADLEMIALTDHFNYDGYDAEFLRQREILKNYLSCISTDVKVLLGCEFSAYDIGKTLEKAETAEIVDYRLYATNHFHLRFWGQPEDRTARGYALYSMEIIKSVAQSGRADCIAHPLVGNYIDSLEDKTEITRKITDNELGDLSEVLRDCHVAWEINVDAFIDDPIFAKRLWNIGRETKTTFHFGTDAHLIANVFPQKYLPKIKRILS